MNEHGAVLQLQQLPGLGLLGLLVAGLAVVLLASRPLALWYWRVDERVVLLREVRDALRRLEEAPPVAPGPPPPPGAAPRRGEHAGQARRRPRGRRPARRRRGRALGHGRGGPGGGDDDARLRTHAAADGRPAPAGAAGG